MYNYITSVKSSVRNKNYTIANCSSIISRKGTSNSYDMNNYNIM